MGGMGAKARTIGYSETATPTIRSVMSGGNTIPDVVYPNVARTLTSEADASFCIDRGQNVVCIEGNGQRESHLGNGYVESEQMYTLNTVEKHAVCYGIGSYASNAMLSSNPHSGIYEAKTSRTLDLNGGNPTCNQGGVAVVQCYQDTVGALCMDDYKGPNRQYVEQDKLVVYDARGNGSGGGVTDVDRRS